MYCHVCYHSVPGRSPWQPFSPYAKIATTSAWQGVARFARHSLRGGSRGNLCVGARSVTTATAWVHRGSVQLVNTTTQNRREREREREWHIIHYSQGRVLYYYLFLGFFSKNRSKRLSRTTGPPRALVLTKLIEQSRFGVRHKAYFFDFFFGGVR